MAHESPLLISPMNPQIFHQWSYSSRFVSFCKAKQDIEAPNKYQLVTKMEVQNDGGFFLLIALRSPWYQRMSGLKALRTNSSNLPVVNYTARGCHLAASRRLCNHHCILRVTGTNTMSPWILDAICRLCPAKRRRARTALFWSCFWSHLPSAGKGEQAWTSTAKVRRCSFRIRNNYANMETQP